MVDYCESEDDVGAKKWIHVFWKESSSTWTILGPTGVVAHPDVPMTGWYGYHDNQQQR